ncbi:MAG: hypothetical protein H8D56_14130 [Planctomycetes bacterium]|nr:hypothetical protein [Planctomycetota bacterium]MBL7146538.1 hypothetical protein [Phycisphaerae bacterium]
MRELYYVYSTRMSPGNQGVFQLMKKVVFKLLPWERLTGLTIFSKHFICEWEGWLPSQSCRTWRPQTVLRRQWASPCNLCILTVRSKQRSAIDDK